MFADLRVTIEHTDDDRYRVGVLNLLSCRTTATTNLNPWHGLLHALKEMSDTAPRVDFDATGAHVRRGTA